MLAALALAAVSAFTLTVPAAVAAPAPGLAQVDVTVAVDWGGGVVRSSQSFSVCLTGPSYPTGSESGACQTVGSAGGTVSWDALTPGDYTTTSTPSARAWEATYAGPSGSNGTTPVTVTASADTTTAVTIDEVPLGTLAFRKVVSGAGDPATPGQTFTVRVTNGSRTFGSSSVVPGGGLVGRQDLQPGTWTFSERDIPAHWTLTDISCTGRDGTSTIGTFDSSSDSIAVTFAGGDRVECVFTNEYTAPGSIAVPVTVDWNGVPVDEGQDFGVCLIGPSYPTGSESGACQTVGGSGGTLNWDDLVPGDYTPLASDDGGEWTASGAGVPTTVTVGGAATAGTIAYVHSAPGEISVTSEVKPGWGDPSDPNPMFPVTIDGDYVDLSGSTGGSAALGRSDLPEGAYTIGQPAPAGWTMTDLTCTSADGTSTIGAFAAATGQLSVSLASGDSVDCVQTFVFATAGTLDVEVQVSGINAATDLSQEFEVCLAGPSFPTGAETGACQSIGTGGGTLSWTGLSPGDYVATQADAGPLWTTSGAGDTTPVAIGTSPTVTISNVHAPLVIVPAVPDYSLEAKCGALTVTFTNAVGQIPSGAIGEDAVFAVTVDGAPASVTVAPNGTEIRVYSFAEGSGAHTVALGAESITVPSDCEGTAAQGGETPASGEPGGGVLADGESREVAGGAGTLAATGASTWTLPLAAAAILSVAGAVLLGARRGRRTAVAPR